MHTRIDVNCPNHAEIVPAIKYLRNEKTPGVHNPFTIQHSVGHSNTGINNWNKGYNIGPARVAREFKLCRRYLLLSHSFAVIKAKLQQVQEPATEVGLCININNTKVFRINLDSTNLKMSTPFAILNISTEAQVQMSPTELKKPNKPFEHCKKYRDHFKFKSLQNCDFFLQIKSSLLYGCESWNASTQEIRSLQV